ncbi:MAG TPA: hypothetical protein P5248_12085, partial [Bacteroidales bacterium]|nr:hypothetical protein [Bacteroidales bacterium]
MKKVLFLMVLSMGILFFGHAANAQMKPMYQYTHYNNDGKSTSGADFHTALSHIAQWIYRPSDLLGLPAGPLRSVYFRIGITYGQYTTPCPVVWDSMWVKMGYTQDSIYKDTIVNGMTGYYVLKSGLTTVFFQPKVTIFFDTANPIGTWVRFPIDGFNYRRDANLVVELSRTRLSYNYGFDWMMTNSCRGCYIGGYIGRPYSSWPSGDQADIGFNDSTSSVPELSTLKGFYAYPNPSQGLF